VLVPVLVLLTVHSGVSNAEMHADYAMDADSNPRASMR
jgi:hypothetical protein